jgi:hypothetical protein
MAEDGEVVERDDERDPRALRAAVPRTMEDVDAVARRLPGQSAEVPEDVAPDLCRAGPAGNGVSLYGDAVEMAQEVAEVAGGARLRQLERRDVDSESEIIHRLARRAFYYTV